MAVVVVVVVVAVVVVVVVAVVVVAVVAVVVGGGACPRLNIMIHKCSTYLRSLGSSVCAANRSNMYCKGG